MPVTAPTCRVGVDMTVVGEVAASVDHFGDRYLRRMFTDHELASCTAEEGWQVSSLAARFAAKEAVVKVLDPVGVRPDWRSIEVRRSPQGSCSIELHGAAADLAQRRGVEEITVSLS